MLALGKLTLRQALCLGSEKPPAAAGVETFGDFESILRARRDAEERWGA
jgi:hypothetical protein